ncbi:amino acid-binding protein [Christensenellaceae bacterium]|nr:amino acid-binding protein [Christensenellaceae bacterium]BDF59861.1 amino acid-binding protein [Christensenellaceae bacterium]
MTVKQISVFLENDAGRLAALTDVLDENGIDMRALSVAETRDFGILRLIVNDSYKTATVLKDAGYICSITPVLAVAIPDEPGGLNKVLRILGENKINLEYTYAFISRKKELAYMVFRVEDNERAIEVLSKNSIKLICQDELYEF